MELHHFKVQTPELFQKVLDGVCELGLIFSEVLQSKAVRTVLCRNKSSRFENSQQ
jgi:hypothetical protein